MMEHEMDLNPEKLDEQLNALAEISAHTSAASLVDQPDVRLIHDLHSLHASAAQADEDSLEYVSGRLREREQLVSAGVFSTPLNLSSQKQSRRGRQKMQYTNFSERRGERSRAHPLIKALAAVAIVGLLGIVLGSFYFWFEAHPGAQQPARQGQQTPIFGATTTPAPAATPGLYHTIPDGISKIDSRTGNVIWKKSFPVQPPDQYVVARDIPIWTTGDDTLFFLYKNGPGQNLKLYALSASTGDVRWVYKLNDPVACQVISAHGVVYFCTAPSIADGPGNATVVALDIKHGNVLWTHALARQLFTMLPAPIGDTLVAANGLLYVNAQTAILALDAQHGTLAWQTPQEPLPTTYDSLAVTSGRIYVIAHTDGRQYVESFDALYGTSPRAFQALGGDLPGDLVAVNGVVYALTTANLGSTGPYQYILSAVDPTSGSVLWSYKGSGSGAQLSVANGRAIIAYDTTDAQGKNIEGLQTVNLQTHRGSWQRVLHQGEQQTIAFTLLGGNIYTASSAGTLTALRATDGTVLWQK